MDRARARFEQYLKGRFDQSNTLKYYISDPNIFIDTIGHTLPEAVTAEDIDTFCRQANHGGAERGNHQTSFR